MTEMKRFTAYRLNMDDRETHNDQQKNPEGEPQYEGVIFTDGTVAIRWLTPLASTSVWSDLISALGVHGHPEYGTNIIWHDHEDIPIEWEVQLSRIDLDLDNQL